MDSQVLARKVRLHALRMTSTGGSSHIGSIFSIVDILSVLYGSILSFDASNPLLSTRDRFILSKGHAGAGVYAVLAESGFFSTDILKTHYQDGSLLSGHVSHKGLPGVELSTGSLGHGLGVATGFAKSLKLRHSDSRVFALLSDGECDEGSNWESALFAQHHKLDNLVCIIDYNKLQSIGTVSQTLELEPFRDKWQSFNWHVIEVDGHNHAELFDAFHQNSAYKNKPLVVICHTTKGKGVSFMENSVLWHYRTARDNEFAQALMELDQL